MSKALRAALLGLGLSSGCGTSRFDGNPLFSFPTSAALAEVAARPSTPSNLDRAPRPIASWKIELKDDAAAWPADWRRAVTEGSVRAGKLSVTPALNCAAREIGRHHVAEHRFPGRQLDEFILAACGSVALQFAY